jgi:hypothetical protein
MKTKTLFMETTTIEASQTSGEIVSYLVQAGAKQVLMEYGGEKGKLTGLKFGLDIPKHGTQIFVLPVSSTAVCSRS